MHLAVVKKSLSFERRNPTPFRSLSETFPPCIDVLLEVSSRKCIIHAACLLVRVSLETGYD